MIDATELQPLTFEQKQAWRVLRFLTAYQDGGRVVGETDDLALAQATGGSIVRWQPDERCDPERVTYEVSSAHPETVAIARERYSGRGS